MPVPFISVTLSATNSPCEWNSGSAWSSTSSGPKPHVWCSASAFDARLSCVSMAPLGRPVVPEV